MIKGHVHYGYKSSKIFGSRINSVHLWKSIRSDLVSAQSQFVEKVQESIKTHFLLPYVNEGLCRKLFLGQVKDPFSILRSLCHHYLCGSITWMLFGMLLKLFILITDSFSFVSKKFDEKRRRIEWRIKSS